MDSKGSIPRKDAEVAPWGDNFVTQLTANAAQWGIPNGEITDLKTDLTDFKTYLAVVESPARTKIAVAQKNATRDRFKEKARTMINFRLKNPVITDSQLTALGVHVHDRTQSNIADPKTRPEHWLEVLDVRRISVHFHDQYADNKAKPYGMDGAVVAFVVLDEPATDIDQLTRTELATRTPHVIQLTDKDRTKILSVAVCWQNRKGVKGPWSEILSTVVP
jgi:hypothetical protein